MLTDMWLMLAVFLSLGSFLSWLGYSVYRLRRSNHDIRNQLHAIAIYFERQYGESPLRKGYSDGEHEHR